MLPLISVAVTETVHAMRFTVETVEAAVVLPSTRWKIQIENSTYWNSNKQPVSEFWNTNVFNWTKKYGVWSIIQGHLSASSELLVSGFNCFDWCLRWKHLELAVAACSDFFRLLQTPYSACCLRHTAGYHYKIFFLNKYNHFVFYFASKN